MLGIGNFAVQFVLPIRRNLVILFGRFHNLQEFDEGSCRRRLAGHNRRRRKTHPDTVVNGGSLNAEKGSSYLLISLLRILSNMHCMSFYLLQRYSLC
jgi:hypothetical protein